MPVCRQTLKVIHAVLQPLKAGVAVKQVQPDNPNAAPVTSIRPNPRLFQLGHSAATAATRSNRKTHNGKMR